MSAYSDLILSKSPLLYWQLDENPPGTGTAADASGNGRTGTYVGSPSSVAGLFSGSAAAVDFVGGTKCVTSAYNPFAVNTSLTFECWVKRATSTNADTMWGSDAAASMVFFRFASGSDTIQFFPQNGNSAAWTSTGVVTGEVYHVVLAWNGSTDSAQLYVNGVDLTSKSVAQDFNATPGNFTVGARRNDFIEQFDGVLDEVAVYSGILSGASILENYQAGVGTPQLLSPSADSVDGTWRTEAGDTTLAASIDETTASDSDYIVSPSDPQDAGCRVKLAAGTDPVSSTGHVVHWRLQKDAAGGSTVGATVKLYQGGGDVQGAGTLIATFTRSNISETWTTFNETLSGAEADSITNYGDLYLEFFADV